VESSVLQFGWPISDNPWTSSKWSVEWGNEVELRSNITDHRGRGMELSDLVLWEGMLLTVDDRTGSLFELQLGPQIQGVVVHKLRTLWAADGQAAKRMKAEWITGGPDGALYVGSTGKDWTALESNEIVHRDLKWVKRIALCKRCKERIQVTHLNWDDTYEELRRLTGYKHPGYIVHEAVRWSSYQRAWVFIPRSMSVEPYDEVLDMQRAANLLLRVQPADNISSVTHMDGHNSSRGVSAFSFVPGHSDQVLLLLKTEESHPDASKSSTIVRSYISVIDSSGAVLLPDQHFADVKYEGVDFFGADERNQIDV